MNVGLYSFCLGDNIYPIPAINYLSKFGKVNVNILLPVFVPIYKEIFKDNNNIEIKTVFKKEDDNVNHQVLEYYRTENIVDLWFKALKYNPNEIPTTYKMFPTYKSEAKYPYVCLHVTYRLEYQRLNPNIWNKIIDGIIDKGLIPVLIGNTPKVSDLVYGVDKLNTEPTMNLVDRLSIFETLDIISRSQYLITPMDGLYSLGLLTDTPMIVMETVISHETFKGYNKRDNDTFIQTTCPDKLCVTKVATGKLMMESCPYKYNCIDAFESIPFV